MTAPIRRPASADPYELVRAIAAALPEGYVVESIAGQIIAQPRPKDPHVRATSALGDELGPPFRRGKGGPGGWVILDEPECHLADCAESVVPDLAAWRRTRLNDGAIPECAHEYYALAPDWICEVLSPSTTRRDRGEKLELYARAGVAHYWLVDPSARTLEVLRRGREGHYKPRASFEGDERVRAEPFDAVALDLAALWAR